MTKKFFTTFEVGEMCQVYHTTVINWINKGQLKAYTTPGKHRRIQRDDLVRFMREFKIHIPPALMGERAKVLAVDDDPNVMRVLRKTFSKKSDNINFQTTSSGVEALVMVGKELPDLILLDVVMPEMDGIQVCRTLKSSEQTKDTKIIVMTGESLSDNQEEFLDQNVEAVFRKPFSPIELLQRSCSLLNLEENQL